MWRVREFFCKKGQIQDNFTKRLIQDTFLIKRAETAGIIQ